MTSTFHIHKLDLIDVGYIPLTCEDISISFSRLEISDLQSLTDRVRVMTNQSRCTDDKI
jgi:hypothetical protein